MNRKGQFYIFTAIILSGIAFSLIQTGTTFRDPNPIFPQLTDNLMHESRKAINNAIYNDESINQTYHEFFTNFMAFAKTKDPKFEAVYLLKSEEYIHIYNGMNANVVIDGYGSYVEVKETEHIKESWFNKTGGLVTLPLDGVNYRFQFNIGSDDPELQALVRSDRQGEKRIKKIEIS